NLRSGFAFANRSAAPVTINYELSFYYGYPTGITGSLTLPSKGQRSLFLDELPGAEQLPKEFKGVLKITTTEDGAVSVIGLRGRTNERGDFLVSTTSRYQAANNSAELFVPHFADGGGYFTEFILLGRIIEPVNATMYFFAPSGQPLSLTTV